MASTLTVDNIVGATTAGNVHVPGGVVQVVNTFESTQAASTVSDLTQSSDYLSATITPKFSSSKILVTGHVIGGGSSAGIGVNVFIKAGGALIPQAELGNDTDGLIIYGLGRSAVADHVGFELLDSPATTNAYTYTISFGRYGGSGTAYVGWNGNKERTSLTLMEIAQ